MQATPKVFIVMGVSGCGKSTVGLALAERQTCQFYDADDFHPAENVAKMAAGNPLNDDDRRPWLEKLAELIREHLEAQRPMVLACSALKEWYRQLLLVGNDQVELIYLKGEFELIWERMSARENHYMRPEMLQSQFDTLEEPEYGIVVSIDQTVDEQLAEISNQI